MRLDMWTGVSLYHYTLYKGNSLCCFLSCFFPPLTLLLATIFTVAYVTIRYSVSHQPYHQDQDLHNFSFFQYMILWFFWPRSAYFISPEYPPSDLTSQSVANTARLIGFKDFPEWDHAFELDINYHGRQPRGFLYMRRTLWLKLIFLLRAFTSDIATHLPSSSTFLNDHSIEPLRGSISAFFRVSQSLLLRLSSLLSNSLLSSQLEGGSKTFLNESYFVSQRLFLSTPSLNFH